MVYIALAALISGIICGMLQIGGPPAALLVAYKENILDLLMVSVGISIGMQQGLWDKIKRYHIKSLLIPAGVVIGSFLGGIICCLLTGYPLADGTAIACSMGWYSLGGITIESLSGAFMGGVAFLSNLMREILSFFSIAFLSRRLNYPSCIAAAGATSEDTTLPMMMKYTNEESVVLSVLNGMICSALVPFLITACYSIFM